MKRHSSAGLASILGCLLLTGCQTAPSVDVNHAQAARKLEMQIDAGGRTVEVEYHISPDLVPQAVRDAMDRLHPGGAFTGAEREQHDGQLYYELSRSIAGREVEAMFTEDGALFSEEIEVTTANVPALIQDRIEERFPNGNVTAWEEVRDGDRELVEYHVKVAASGKNYKAVVSLAGVVEKVLREIVAEVEVPVTDAR